MRRSKGLKKAKQMYYEKESLITEEMTKFH